MNTDVKEFEHKIITICEYRNLDLWSIQSEMISCSIVPVALKLHNVSCLGR